MDPPAPRLDRLPDDCLLPIFSNLIENDEEFFVNSLTKSSPVTSERTTDLRNVSLACKSFASAAQELIIHTVTVDDYKLHHPPFTSSNLFKVIKLLVERSHIRPFIKQLQIALPAGSGYLHLGDTSVVHLLHRLHGILNDENHEGEETSNDKKDTATNQWNQWLSAWTRAHGLTKRAQSASSDEIRFGILPEPGMETKGKCIWVALLLLLTPKLEKLRLWASTDPEDTEDWDMAFSDTQSLLLRHPSTKSAESMLSNLSYVSIDVHYPQNLAILHSFPKITTVDLWLSSRSLHQVFRMGIDPTAVHQIPGVKHSRWCLDYACDNPWNIHISVLGTILPRFVAMATTDVYCRVESDRLTHREELIEIMFGRLMDALSSSHGTLKSLRYSVSVDEKTFWYFPDLSAFSAIRRLILPQCSRGFVKRLPYTLDTIVFEHANKFVFRWLREYFRDKDSRGTLKKVELCFDTRREVVQVRKIGRRKAL